MARWMICFAEAATRNSIRSLLSSRLIDRLRRKVAMGILLHGIHVRQYTVHSKRDKTGRYAFNAKALKASMQKHANGDTPLKELEKSKSDLAI
jgi:hypothetical protein